MHSYRNQERQKMGRECVPDTRTKQYLGSEHETQINAVHSSGLPLLDLGSTSHGIRLPYGLFRLRWRAMACGKFVYLQTRSCCSHPPQKRGDEMLPCR